MNTIFRNLLQLIALSALAVGQPLLDKLGNHPEFFIARRSEHIDFFYLAFALFLLLPAALFLIETPFLLLRSKLAGSVHFILMGTLAALTAIPVLRSIPGFNAWGILCAAVFVGLGFSMLLYRYERMQQFCVALAVTALAFPIFFLTRPGIKELAYPRVVDLNFEKIEAAQKSPVILLVLSELPLSALMTQDLSIDAKRFPNFAALAQQSHWFRNASSVSPFTSVSLPAILTGTLPPESQRLSNSEQYSQNLFSLLGSTHYLHTWERVTRLCPETLCHISGTPPAFAERIEELLLDVSALYINMIVPREFATGLPDVTSDWIGFWRTAKDQREKGPDFRRNDRTRIFRFWTREIQKTERPVLHFAHHLLPRGPYQFSNSARFYNGPETRMNNFHSISSLDSRETALNYQRFLVQVAAVDSLLGQLIEQLKSQDLFDQSLIIVTADHGFSLPTAQNQPQLSADSRLYDDLLSIPLFVKVPGQKLGVVDDRNVESIDILPTVVDVLKINTSWQFDGQSVFDTSAARPDKTVLLGAKPNAIQSGSAPSALRLHKISSPKLPGTQTIEWKNSVFDSGNSQAEFSFSFANHHDLLGLPIVASAASNAGKVQIMHPPLTLGPEGSMGLAGKAAVGPLPLFIDGYFNLPGEEIAKTNPQIIISINEKVVNVAESYLKEKQLRFEALLPESALSQEFNSLTFHARIESESGTVIIPLDPR